MAAENRIALTNPKLADALLRSVRFYDERGRWWAHLALIMPDHLHLLLAFPAEEQMSRVISDWKRWHGSKDRVMWQDNYFDHRIRNPHELELKDNYIRENPVAKGLCPTAENWPWVWPSTVDVALRAREGAIANQTRPEVAFHLPP
jgi:REP element-mobilizing transposase RayT